MTAELTLQTSPLLTLRPRGHPARAPEAPPARHATSPQTPGHKRGPPRAPPRPSSRPEGSGAEVGGEPGAQHPPARAPPGRPPPSAPEGGGGEGPSGGRLGRGAGLRSGKNRLRARHCKSVRLNEEVGSSESKMSAQGGSRKSRPKAFPTHGDDPFLGLHWPCTAEASG